MNGIIVGSTVTLGLVDGSSRQALVISCADAGCRTYLTTDTGCRLVHFAGLGSMPLLPPIAGSRAWITG